jgi:excisionase family DNA binding protein
VLRNGDQKQRAATLGPGLDRRKLSEEKLDMAPLLNIGEVAKLLAVSTITVRRKVHDGELPCIRLTEGGPMRFDVRDIEKFVAAHKS